MIKRFVIGMSLLTFMLPIPRAWGEEPIETPAATRPPVISIAEGSPLFEARQAYDAGQLKQARRLTEKFLDRNEKSAEGWALLGKIYLAAGSSKKAFKKFNKALKFDSHYAPAYVGRGEYFEKKGRLDEAANDYRAATLSDPTLVEAKQALDRLTGKSSDVPTEPTATLGDSTAPGRPIEPTAPTGTTAPTAISGDSDDRGRPTGTTAPTAQ